MTRRRSRASISRSRAWRRDGKTAVMGALNLYLDFLNMFLFLLRFMGNRR